MTTLDPKAPLLAAHLLAACDDAERATKVPIETAAGPRRYAQASWDCGTACCLHGFAHIRARGVAAPDHAPWSGYWINGASWSARFAAWSDYQDAPYRAAVLALLSSSYTRPSHVRTLLQAPPGLSPEEVCALFDTASYHVRMVVLEALRDEECFW